MQTKRKSLEFTNKQNNQLKQLKDMVKLHKLQEKCEEFKGELENLITEKTNILQEREKLMENINSLQGEVKIARNEEFNWQKKLETGIILLKILIYNLFNLIFFLAKKSFFDLENDNLQSICMLLGYQISKHQELENNGLQITVCYIKSRKKH